jgi:hypothetical protein
VQSGHEKSIAAASLVNASQVILLLKKWNNQSVCSNSSIRPTAPSSSARP